MAERYVAKHSRHPIENLLPETMTMPWGLWSHRGGKQDLGLGLGRMTRTAQLCLAKQNHGQLSLIVPEARI